MNQRLGEYELISQLGAGASGSVFLARHVALGRQVAIKLLLVSSERNLARFEGEAQAVARLRHPHLVKLHEAHLDAPQPYLVMSYIQGESLDGRIERVGPMASGLVTEIALQLADALAHAHTEGLLHRDVKPANVLIDADGVAYLTDFGLAKDLASDREALTLTGQIVGTPAFMAPEQATGERDSIGPPTDVYGLGATLYAMLTGRAPHERTNMMALVAAVASEPPTPLRELLPNIDPGLATVVERCLAKSPAKRYASARDLVEDLKRVQAGERPSGWPRWLPALAVLLLGALLALAARTWIRGPEPAPSAVAAPKQPAAPARRSSSPSAAPPAPRRWLDSHWSLVQRWPPEVVACTGLVRNNTQWLMAVTSQRDGPATIVHAVPLKPGSPFHPIWSGSARRVLSDPELRRVLLVTDTELVVAHPRGAVPMTLSPRWRAFFSEVPLADAGRSEGLVLLALSKGSAFVGHPEGGPKRVPDALEGSLRGRPPTPQEAWLSPDGRYLLSPAIVDQAIELRCSVLHEAAPSKTVPIVARQVMFSPGESPTAVVLAQGVNANSGILFSLSLPGLRPLQRVDIDGGLQIVAVTAGGVLLGGRGTLFRWDRSMKAAVKLPGRYPTTWGPVCSNAVGDLLYCGTPAGVYVRRLPKR